MRTFSPAHEMLVLVPTVNSKFLANEVMEKVGEVTEKISQPGRRKLQQIYCNVTLLKPWKDKESLKAGNSLIAIHSDSLIPKAFHSGNFVKSSATGS